jgi:capsular exopolysaccharide synthesis family protein
VELRDYIAIVRAHFLGILALIAAGTGLGGAYTLTQDPVYCADATGFVTTGTSADGVQASVNDSLAKSRAASYVSVAQSRAVAELVIDELGLAASPSGLVGAITVTQPENTVLINVRGCDSTPLKAQQLSDAWVRGVSVRVGELENPQNLPSAGILGVEPVEAAALPTTPVSPQPRRNLFAGALLGLFLGLLYALIRSRLDRRLKSLDLPEREFRVPVVGTIPDRKGTGREGIAMSGSHDGAASWGTGEAYRKLRTNLAYMKVDNPPQVIVVTSPRPRDGKSTIAANLAAAIALSGREVTLVDADLRRPTVAATLGLVEGAGLTDVLIGNATLEDVLQPVPGFDGRLSALAAGAIPPNPSELLESFAMQKVLADLAERGVVILDAPPLLPVTDGAILTRHSDGAIVVVRYNQTLDQELAAAFGELDAVQGTVLGTVLNRVPAKDAPYGYYGSYYDSNDGDTDGKGKGRSRGRSKSGSGGHRAKV